MSRQLYYGLGLFQEAMLGCPSTLSISIFTGYKTERETIDSDFENDVCDYDLIEQIFKDCGKEIEVGAAENLHDIFGQDEAELRALATRILEVNGYKHEPEWDYK